jgi:hypothetical protein
LTLPGEDFKIKGNGGAHIFTKGIAMRNVSRARLFLGVLTGLSVCLLAGLVQPTAAQDKDKEVDFKRVPLPTIDGMELQGTFYPTTTGSKDAVVLLLHNIDARKGGGSHEDGWSNLAAMLQKEGYAVLSFDFRGFGGSKTVTPQFWAAQNTHNKGLKGAYKMPESIDQKDFPPQYYPFLVNDIAAARAYLDRQNDSRLVNTSNLIVIGAGEGATLGALWMAAEMRRQKDKASIQIGLPPQLDEPEGKDFAAAIWLSISPTLAGRSMTSALKADLVDVAQTGKVPTVFIYGKNDSKADSMTEAYVKAIKYERGKPIETLKRTGAKAIKGTELAGSKLLQENFETLSFIKDHLAKVMEDRGSREWKKREEDKYAYYWNTSWPRPATSPILCKRPGAELPLPIPLSLMKVGLQ